METRKPRLRELEAFPIEDGKALALRDPEGLSEGAIIVPGALLPILELFDGAHTVADIAAELGRPGDAQLAAKALEMMETLDARMMLEGPRVEAERARRAKDYASAAARPATHAGRAYPAEPAALAADLDGCFTAEGAPPSRAPSAPGRLRALIAPHIDYRRGAASYAWAYRELGEGADLYVILGTCHAGLHVPFAATAKDYLTPFGAAETDRETLTRLSKRAGLDLLTQEPAHRLEHSIELQAVWLKHAAPKSRPFKILPVLASYCHELMATGLSPRTDARVRDFTDALREELIRPGRDVCLIVGADLAHMGTQFGDPALTPEEMKSCESEDLALLGRAEAGDPDGFFSSIAANLDRRRICGFSPIHAALTALEGTGVKGSLLSYGQWPDPEGLVSYASLAYR